MADLELEKSSLEFLKEHIKEVREWDDQYYRDNLDNLDLSRERLHCGMPAEEDVPHYEIVPTKAALVKEMQKSINYYEKLLREND